ncbi:MAG TPA: hypothetical protein VLV49_10140 [Terriglobales bacterium]|nr:hypothetical protein [Terriglobales bacterium]
MFYKRCAASMLALVVLVVASAGAEESKPAAAKIPKGAKLFIAPIGDGFDNYLKDAIAKKKVPVEVVASKDQAEYEITGTADSQKASTAKKVILGNWHSREEASITVSSIKSGEVVWAYSVHEEASTHGKRSSAEACAKHLKDEIEK